MDSQNIQSDQVQNLKPAKSKLWMIGTIIANVIIISIIWNLLFNLSRIIFTFDINIYLYLFIGIIVNVGAIWWGVRYINKVSIIKKEDIIAVSLGTVLISILLETILLEAIFMISTGQYVILPMTLDFIIGGLVYFAAIYFFMTNAKPSMERPKINRSTVIILLVIGILVVVGLIYLAASRRQDQLINDQSSSVLSGWETYRSEEYGFEFNYPNDWFEIQPAMDFKGIGIGPDSNSVKIGITFYDDVSKVSWSYGSKQPKTLEEYMKDPMFQNAKSIDFLGNKAFSATVVNPAINYSATEILVEHNNHIYEISYDNDTKIIDIAEKIIPTFKFIPTVNETTNWQTYSNEKYGFEFSYPKDNQVYSKINCENENKILVPAGPDSEYLDIAEGRDRCAGESDVLYFKVIKNQNNPREWLNKNYLPSVDNVSVKDIIFAGYRAVEAKGEGYINSPYKMVVVPFDNYILLIYQNLDTKFFNDILTTFKFTK
jgi:hypothetical protein